VTAARDAALPPVEDLREGGWTCRIETALARPLLAAGLLEAAERGAGPASAATGRASHARLRVEDAGGAAGVIVRRYRHGGLLAPLTGDRFLSSARFTNEFELGRRAWAEGVPTARPVAVGWRGGLSKRGFIATLAIPGARDLLDLFVKPVAEPKRLAAARACALAVRRMHDAGIDHADLHLKNLLVGEGPGGAPGETAFVIDLDLARRGSGPLDGRARVSNLARLFRSAEKHRRAGLAIGDAEIEAFCEAYFGDDAGARATAHRALGIARIRAGLHARKGRAER
jgi:3-deoxy-D-manno-octulosonic acid kinase